jgi:hypothetical protein
LIRQKPKKQAPHLKLLSPVPCGSSPAPMRGVNLGLDWLPAD